MSKSRFEYVREFEENDAVMKQCYIVLRIDGSNFHRFSDKHGFVKPNDERALRLANRAAHGVMQILPDCTIAYGQSDEYSFVLRPDTTVHGRRRQKLVSLAVSKFTAVYQFYWAHFFPDTALLYPPAFDGRLVLYPSEKILRDYLAWRQVDCHINNLYNTTFHALIQKQGLTASESEKRLSKTLSKEKNEILFQLGINYNDEKEIFKKGSVLVGAENRKENEGEVDTWEVQSSEESKHLQKRQVLVLHVDIIKDPFWQRYPNLLLPLDEVKKAKKRQLQTNCNKNKDKYFHFVNIITITTMKLYFIFLDFKVLQKH